MSEYYMSRKSERKLAAQFLYSLEYTQCHSIVELEHSFGQYLAQEEKKKVYSHEDFSWCIITGVWTYQKEIDNIIATFAHNWKVERIGKMELVALRIALYEILYTPDVPKKVVLKEALDIVRSFGDTHANAFIIGIVEQVSKDV